MTTYVSKSLMSSFESIEKAFETHLLYLVS